MSSGYPESVERLLMAPEHGFRREISMKIAHIVNPVHVTNPQSDLSYAQPLTLASMGQARAVAAEAGIDVRLVACTYEEDRGEIPPDFIETPLLPDSILEHVVGGPGDAPRKLPLLRDILDRLLTAAPDADYLIYSNIDIGLQPDFYVEVARRIEDSGWRAFSIMRHTVDDTLRSVDDLDRIHALPGEAHGGYSCFVFPRTDLERYDLGEVCIGIQPVSILLMLNMIINSERFDEENTARLCFHLGDERAWQAGVFDAYHLWNEQHLDAFQTAESKRILAHPLSTRIWRAYQRRRSGWVIHNTRPKWLGQILKLVRTLGGEAWVGSKYRSVRPKPRSR